MNILKKKQKSAETLEMSVEVNKLLNEAEKSMERIITEALNLKNTYENTEAKPVWHNKLDIFFNYHIENIIYSSKKILEESAALINLSNGF